MMLQRPEKGAAAPYIFISYALEDAPRTQTSIVLEALLNADISLGIDNPARFNNSDALRGVAKWSIRPGEDWDESIARALWSPDCVGAVLMHSEAYWQRAQEDQNTARHFVRLREAEIASGRHAQARLDGSNSFLCVCALLDSASGLPPPLAKLQGVRATADEIERLIESLKAHLSAVQSRRLTTQEVLKTYCAAVAENTRWISLPGRVSPQGQDRLELDHVFVTLQGSGASGQEVEAAHREAFARIAVADAAAATAIEEDAALKHLAETGQSLRGIPKPQDDESTAPVWASSDLAEVCRKNARAVVLGDPGSGKTTLVSWLVRKHAQHYVEGDGSDLSAPSEFAVPDAGPGGATRSLGRALVPIFISLKKFHEFRERAAIRGENADLRAYFGRHDWRPRESGDDYPISNEEVNHALNVALTDLRSVLLVLDGLDEVPSEARGALVSQIDAFVHRHIAHDRSSFELGSQFIATSRIIGYEIAKVGSAIATYTIEPLSRRAVGKLWASLFSRLLADPEAGAKKAEELQQRIFAPELERAQRLAGNPLLATLLGLIYFKSGRVPQFRVELYAQAVHEFAEGARRSEWSSRQWRKILSPAAAHLLDQGGHRQLHEDDFRKLLALHHGDGADLEETLDIIKTQVGLVVERGAKIYDFVHRQLLEYLGALWLLGPENQDDDEALAARFLRRYRQIAWRESILLALGELGRAGVSGSDDGVPASAAARRNRIVETLIEAAPAKDATGAFLRLIAEGLAQMPEQPDERVIEALARKLLAHLIDPRRGGFVHKRVGRLVSRALAQISSRGEANIRIVETMLCNELRNSDGQRRAAAARYVLLEKWQRTRIVRALKEARPTGVKEFDAAIAKALRRAATGVRPRQRQDKLNVRPEWKAKSPEERFEQVNAARYSRRIEAEARWREGLDDYLSKPSTATFNSISAREFADALPDEWIKDFRWRAIYAALFGGLGDTGALGAYGDYHDLAVRLNAFSVGTGERSSDIELNERFGVADTVLAAADHLSTAHPAVMPIVFQDPSFDPKRATRENAHGEAVVSAAENGADTAAALIEAARVEISPHAAATLAFAAICADTDALLSCRAIVADLAPEARKHLLMLAREALEDNRDALFRSVFGSQTSAGRHSRLGELVARSNPGAREACGLRAIVGVATLSFADLPFELAPDWRPDSATFAPLTAELLGGAVIGIPVYDAFAASQEAREAINALDDAAALAVMQHVPVSAVARWGRVSLGTSPALLRTLPTTPRQARSQLDEISVSVRRRLALTPAAAGTLSGYRTADADAKPVLGWEHLCASFATENVEPPSIETLERELNFSSEEWQRAFMLLTLVETAASKRLAIENAFQQESSHPHRAILQGNLRFLISVNADWLQTSAPQSDIVLPIYLARTAYDVIDALERHAGEDEMERNFAAYAAALRFPTAVAGADIARLVDARSGDQGEMTRNLIRHIRALGADEALELAPWLQSSDPLRQAIAGLNLFETGRSCNASVIAPLLDSERIGDELTELRIAASFCRGTHNLKRPPRELCSSWFEDKTLLDVAKDGRNLLVGDIRFDDAEQLRRLIRIASSRSPRRKYALKLISGICAATIETSSVLLASLQSSDRELTTALLEALAGLCWNKDVMGLENAYEIHELVDEALGQLPNERMIGFQLANSLARIIELTDIALAKDLDDASIAREVLKTSADTRLCLKDAPESRAQFLADYYYNTDTYLINRFSTPTLMSGVEPRDLLNANSRYAGIFAEMLLAFPPAPGCSEADEAERQIVLFTCMRYAQEARALFWAPERRAALHDKVEEMALEPDVSGSTLEFLLRLSATSPEPLRDTVADRLMKKMTGARPQLFRAVLDILSEPLFASEEAIGIFKVSLSSYSPRVRALAARALAAVASHTSTSEATRVDILQLLEERSSDSANAEQVYLFQESQNANARLSSICTVEEAILDAIEVVERRFS